LRLVGVFVESLGVVGVGIVCRSLVAPRRGWALAAVPWAGVLALGFAGAEVSLHCLGAVLRLSRL
jgi:hypothetical protein